MEPLRIFIGFDPRQVISYTACHTSIMEHATVPVAITPLNIKTLPIERTGLTPFTYSRFLVPWLCGFKGRALFMDADIILRDCVLNLFKVCAGTDKAVWVRDDPGYGFERAALMLFNCGHPDNAVLAPEFVDDAEKCKTPHLIDWTKNIGVIPSDWGHLVGYNAENPDAKLVHFTQGVPAWPETLKCEFAQDWLRTVQIANWPWQIKSAETQVPWEALMGNSVHMKKLSNGRMVPRLYKEEWGLSRAGDVEAQ